MFLNWSDGEDGYTILQYGILNTPESLFSSVEVTLEDILACCQNSATKIDTILELLAATAFRRERITNTELSKQIKEATFQILDMKKEVRRRRIPGGSNNATTD